MSNRLILSQRLSKKFEEVDYSLDIWTDISANSSRDLETIILEKLNGLNKKLSVKKIEYGQTGQNSQSYGFVCNKDNKIIAHIFIIPPGSAGRNIVAQCIMTGLYAITSGCIKSNSYELTNLPVYIIYTNQDKIQKSKSQEIISAKILGFHFSDIFERDAFEEIKNKELYYESYDILKYDMLLSKVSDDNINNYFEVNLKNKIIVFKTDRLGDASTNERYFFSLKCYPALYLASRECYTINIDALINGNYENETIKTFISYADKLKNI